MGYTPTSTNHSLANMRLPVERNQVTFDQALEYMSSASPTSEELHWFRWITGHQTAFLLWLALSRLLNLLLGHNHADSIEAMLGSATRLLRGYTSILVYTASCPRELYMDLIRPYMALSHKGFTGKWARDYRPIPRLIGMVIARYRSDTTIPGLANDIYPHLYQS